MVGNQNLVRVAVVHDPRQAIPLQGTWIGSASDHLAMKVAVKVTARRMPARGADDNSAGDDARDEAPDRKNFCAVLFVSNSGTPLARAEKAFDEDSCRLRNFL